MPIDRDDADFMSGMKDLLDLKDEQIDDILSKIDSDDLLELQDAITAGDKERALKAIRSASVDEDDDPDINPLFRSDKDKDEYETKKKTKKNRHRKDIDFHVGDAVLVGDDEIEGTVEKPNAPHDLVGVRINGKLKMRPRKDIKLDETVLGMTGMGGLARMQQLAGISPIGPAPEMSVASEPLPSVEVEVMEPETDGEQSCADQAMAALDQLAIVLPGVTVAELKQIRARISEITMIMNESIGAVRKPKV